MEKNKPLFKSISLDQDLLIYALAAEKNKPDVFHEIAFRASDVGCTIKVDDKISALVLKTQLTIPVALPFRKLTAMIYEPDFRSGSSLDLTLITGQSVKDVRIPQLADEFNAQAKEITISAILRKNYTNKTIRYDFSEADVASFEDTKATRSKTKMSVTVHFNDMATKTPFNGDKVAIDMPYDEFMAALAEAKKKGQPTLDLSSLFAKNPQRYGFNPE